MSKLSGHSAAQKINNESLLVVLSDLKYYNLLEKPQLVPSAPKQSCSALQNSFWRPC